MTMSDAVLGVAGLFFLWAQNQGFRRQNDIFAITAGSEPITPAKESTFSVKRYWPLIAMVVLVGAQWVWLWMKNQQIKPSTQSTDSSSAPWILGIGIALMVGHTIWTNWIDNKAIQALNAAKKAAPQTTELVARLKIIEAHYGVEKINNPDVTHYLLERLHGNSYAELVGADLFQGFDPLPGNPNKILTVRYSFDGREMGIVRPEHEWLILPEDMFLRKLLDACQQYKAGSAIFSRLQIDLIQLARDLRKMLNENPGPSPLTHAASGEEMTSHMIQHEQWTRKVKYLYDSDFAVRVRESERTIGKQSPMLAAYLSRFNNNGYMQQGDIGKLIWTIWGLVVKLEEPLYDIH